MKNLESFKRIKGAHDAHIKQLFWIAGSFHSDGFTHDLLSLLEDLDDKDWESLFPEIHTDRWFENAMDNMDEEIPELFSKYNKFGLLAEVHIPKCENFTFKGDKVDSYTQLNGHSIIRYVYSETLEELTSEIEKTADEEFNHFIRTDKIKKGMDIT